MEYKQTEQQREKHREYMRVYRAANPEKIKAYNRLADAKRRRENPKYRQYKLDWQRANPERRAVHARKYYYALSEAGWNEIFNAQGRACAICKRDTLPGKSTWHVDHCHVTGKFRGILCKNCNSALGMVCDDVSVLRTMIEYLECAKREDQ
jgi:hypothetical protein